MSNTFSPATPGVQSAKSTRPDGYWLILAGLLVLYVVIFTGLAFNQHAAFHTHKSDLGQMDQALWNSSRGRFVEEIKQDFLSTRLTDHVEPIFMLAGMIFWVWNDVRAILLLQVLAVALGAIPLFALARRKIGAPLALSLALAYLLNPSLQSAVLTEFHAIPLAVPFILWAFWAIDTRHWWQFFTATLLLAAVKEEAALLAAGLGVWALWRMAISPKKNKTGLTLAVSITGLSLLWFYVATFIIVPAHGAAIHRTAQSVYFQRYGALGNSPLSIIKNIFTNPKLVWSVASEPARMRYLLGLFASFGFLSLLGLDVILLTLPLLLANLLSAYPAQYYGDFHYTAPLAPYFAVAALYGLARLLRFFRTTGARPLLLTLLAMIWLLGWAGYGYSLAGRGPLGGAYDRASITPHQQRLARFIQQIPDEAAVTATASLHPHLSHRRFIYQFPHGLQAQAPAQPATWALLDVTGDTDMAPGDLYTQVQTMLAGDWGVIDAADGYLLLRRGAPDKTIPDAFYDFVRTSADPAAMQQTYPLTFAGISAEAWPRWRQTQISTEWLVGNEFKPGAVRPWLELRTPDGQLLYTYDQITPPALIWYPPSRWQPGERIRITTLPMYPPRYWGAAVGVVHGPDPFQPNHRLPASAITTTDHISSVDGTLALVAAYTWDARNQLRPIPLATLRSPRLGPQLEPSGQARVIHFHMPDGNLIPLEAWLPQTSPSPGRPFDFWLRWQQGIPAGYQPFVHLRRNGENVVQRDGPPHLFIPIAGQQPTNDWREALLPPENARPGETIELYIGLYQLETGQRLDIIGPDGRLAGNEFKLGAWTIAPSPVPDQTCALIPATCLSQP